MVFLLIKNNLFSVANIKKTIAENIISIPKKSSVKISEISTGKSIFYK